MGMQAMVERFIRSITEVSSGDELGPVMEAIARDLGFQYFALMHHVDVRIAASAIRLHNYPARWADHYDRHALGISDPVHRASHRTSIGFAWSRIPALIPLSPGDRRTLEQGRAEGIGEGFTVPAHVPGEARGSCTFASEAGHPILAENFPMAQLAGSFAFEAARHLWHTCTLGGSPGPVLTDRQRDCVLWAARGKGDWEISRILGVSQETVAMHIKQARERYGVPKRSLVAIRALFDGTLSFDDILRR